MLYGGAAGGGKSEALLMGALQYADVVPPPGQDPYAAILLRRTFRQLAFPGALMSRADQWLRGTDASWSGQEKEWRFPTGAVLKFGYLEHPGDELQYQSAEFQYVGFDELTQFPAENQYTFLASRLRRLEGSIIPIRLRGATNPGGPGHTWVLERYNLNPRSGPPGFLPESNRAFISATLDDNPFIDKEEYEKALGELSTLTRQQLRLGDWSAGAHGGKFDPAYFRIISPDDVPKASMFSILLRHWDLAATAKTEHNSDPDWTAGALIGKTRMGRDNFREPDWYIFDIARCRRDPGGTEEFVAEVAHKDGVGVIQSFEQERGGAGKSLVASYRAHVLPNHIVRGRQPSGDKATRAAVPAARSREGRVYLVGDDGNNEWISLFLDEAGNFPIGSHDDQVDAVSGGFANIELEELIGKEDGPVEIY